MEPDGKTSIVLQGEMDVWQTWEKCLFHPLSLYQSPSSAQVCLAHGGHLTWENTTNLAEALKWMHEDDEKDCWISQAAFTGQQRDAGHIAFFTGCSLHLRHSETFYPASSDEGVRLILDRCQPPSLFPQPGIPRPSFILYTGTGYYVKWLFKRPLAGTCLALWRQCQDFLHHQFKDLGSDPSCLDPTAMFRVPGFLNHDCDPWDPVEKVRAVYYSNSLYEINDLAADLLPIQGAGEEKVEPSMPEDWLNDVLAIHPASEQWVCLAFLTDENKWRHKWARAKDLPDVLRKLEASPDFLKQNTYVSQLEFCDRKRGVNFVSSMNVNFLDLDGKLAKDLTPDEWQGLILDHCRKYNIPEPNDMVFTGNGIHVKWIYTKPVSGAELERWNFIERLLFVQFEALGADAKSLDAARVLRVPGTINCKPGTEDNKVRVIHHGPSVNTFEEFATKVEASTPVNAEKFKECVAEWEKSREALEPEAPDISAYFIENSETALNRVEEDWLLNTLHQHHPRNTWVNLAHETGEQSLWVQTYQLHDTLRRLDLNQGWKMSLAEYAVRSLIENKSHIRYIPCNFVVLSRCPGVSMEDKVENIKKRCQAIRDVGIPEPNQIIATGKTLIVEWSYTAVLPGVALSRWKVVQEFLCRYFEEWGAVEAPEYQTVTALLPLPGFKDEDGTAANLAYHSSEIKYSFHELATAVLHFSQQAVKKYKEEKAEEKAQKQKEWAKKKAYRWNSGDFSYIANARYLDILHLLELRKDRLTGNVPQGCRELCLFWAMNFAIQAGEVTPLNFEAHAQSLIDFCGPQFRSECGVKALATLHRKLKNGEKIYLATDAKLIKALGMTEEEQREMVTLTAHKEKKVRKNRVPRPLWEAEHHQERDKPWEDLKLSRRTFFRRKKAALEATMQAEEEERRRREEERQKREEERRQRRKQRRRMESWLKGRQHRYSEWSRAKSKVLSRGGGTLLRVERSMRLFVVVRRMAYYGTSVSLYYDARDVAFVWKCYCRVWEKFSRRGGGAFSSLFCLTI